MLGKQTKWQFKQKQKITENVTNVQMVKESNFNNKTLTEFLLILKDSNQKLRHQLLFHVFSLLCLESWEVRGFGLFWCS